MNLRARLRFASIGLLLALAAPAALAQDLAITAIVAPISGCALGASQSVAMRITNYGPTLAAGTNILVLYNLDSNPGANDTVMLTSAFQTNTSLVHTFAMPADLSVSGAHTFTYAINPSGDINPGNNTVSGYVVVNTAPTVAGTLTGPATATSGTLSLSGSTGSVEQWEESPDNLRWFKLYNTSATQGFADLRAATRYRVRVANAPCPAAVSNVVTVTP